MMSHLPESKGRNSVEPLLYALLSAYELGSRDRDNLPSRRTHRVPKASSDISSVEMGDIKNFQCDRCYIEG